jgi:hypothetical protein
MHSVTLVPAAPPATTGNPVAEGCNEDCSADDAMRSPGEPVSKITWSMIWQFVVLPGAQI